MFSFLLLVKWLVSGCPVVNGLSEARVLHLSYVVMMLLWAAYFSWLGGYGESETPDYIPNSEVKPFSAYGTLS